MKNIRFIIPLITIFLLPSCNKTEVSLIEPNSPEATNERYEIIKEAYSSFKRPSDEYIYMDELGTNNIIFTNYLNKRFKFEFKKQKPGSYLLVVDKVYYEEFLDGKFNTYFFNSNDNIYEFDSSTDTLFYPENAKIINNFLQMPTEFVGDIDKEYYSSYDSKTNTYKKDELNYRLTLHKKMSIDDVLMYSNIEKDITKIKENISSTFFEETYTYCISDFTNESGKKIICWHTGISHTYQQIQPQYNSQGTIQRIDVLTKKDYLSFSSGKILMRPGNIQ